MKEHVMSEALERLQNGTLPLAQLVAIGQHARDCEECRSAVDAAVRVSKRVAGLRQQLEHDDELHVTFEDLKRIAEWEHLEDAMVHLERCEICRQDLADLRALRAPHRAPLRMWAVAAALVLLIGAGVLFTRERRSQERPPIAATTPAISTAPAAAEPSVTATDYGNEQWNAWVRNATTARRLEIPAALLDLRPPAVSFRSPEGTAAARGSVVYPYGAIVRDPRPTFRWSAPEGAESVVQVYDGHEAVAVSEPVRAQRWRPPVPLRAGETYSWQVVVKHGDETRILPEPPAPPALFRILDARERNVIAAAEAKHPHDDLLLAVVYAHFGLEKEALEAMERHAARARTPAANALLKSLQAWSAPR
jgi:hypothetical protein